jgi:hypothetical protein
MYGGSDDQLPVFIDQGYWTLGWPDPDAADQAWRRDQIAPGDRLAVKRMLGQGSGQIEIRALGVVTGIADCVDEDGHKRVFVRWAVTDLERLVESRGCFKSIHGPFGAIDQWTREVFLL